MTIRDKEKYTAALWDWGVFDKCFGATRIRVSDLDGIVERNGQFLVIEAKGPEVPLTTGQRRMFEAMRATSVFTILILYGLPNAATQMEVMFPSGRNVKRACTMPDVERFVQRWFAYANTKSRDYASKHGLRNDGRKDG